jgi:hypothetical protein
LKSISALDSALLLLAVGDEADDNESDDDDDDDEDDDDDDDGLMCIDSATDALIPVPEVTNVSTEGCLLA